MRLLNGFTVQEIVDRLGGSIVGDRSTTVTNVGTIKNAEKGQIAFYSDRSLSPYISNVKASVVVVSLEDSYKFDGAITKIIVEKPHFYFSQVLELMFEFDEGGQGISASAYVGTNVLLSDDVTVGPHVIVEDGAEISKGVSLRSRCFVGKKVKIGRNTVVHAGALILDECEIGNNCVIHSGAVVGGDGFGYVQEENEWIKVRQVGRVIINDACEIGCNTTIDRGSIDNTIIGHGVKIDNQVQIGHNCNIGDNTIIAGCVGIAGSVDIGQNCRIGGAAMFTGHLSVCDNVDVSAGSLVSKSILRPGRYTSVYPLSEHADWKRNAAAIRKLSELNKRIKKLENIVAKATGTDVT